MSDFLLHFSMLQWFLWFFLFSILFGVYFLFLSEKRVFWSIEQRKQYKKMCIFGQSSCKNIDAIHEQPVNKTRDFQVRFDYLVSIFIVATCTLFHHHVSVTKSKRIASRLVLLFVSLIEEKVIHFASAAYDTSKQKICRIQSS